MTQVQDQKCQKFEFAKVMDRVLSVSEKVKIRGLIKKEK